MWRIFSKKNRTQTIAGVVALVIGVYLVYRYLLPEQAKAWVYSWVANPSFETMRDSGLTTHKVPGWTGSGSRSEPMSFGGGTTAGSPIDLSS